MGIFGKAKEQQQQQQQQQQAGLQLITPADPERPPLKSAASEPAHHGQDSHTSTDQQHVHIDGHVYRAQSEPAGAKKRHGALPQKDTLTENQRQTLQHLQMLSKVMDNAVTIPIIKKRIGLDAMIGLIPYAGDMAGATVGTYIITRALKYNMPKRLVARMMVNQAIDSCIGVIPFVGDIFDIGFKANTRNMKLLQEHLEHPKKATRSDTCFLITLFFLVVVVPMMLVVGIIAAIVLGILAAVGKLH